MKTADQRVKVFTMQPAPKRRPAAKPPTRAPRARKPASPPAPKPPKRRTGRPSYVRTDQGAVLVRNLAAAGVVQSRISALLGITVKTMRKHYRAEIRTAQHEIDALAVAALLRAMRGGGKEAVIAAIWWQKCRMGWSAVTAIDDKKPASTSLRIVIELVGAPLTAQKPAALAASRAA